MRARAEHPNVAIRKLPRVLGWLGIPAVLVVAGSGHTALLRDFLRIDRRIKARDIKPYL